MLSKKESTRQSKMQDKHRTPKQSKWRGSRKLKRQEKKARQDSGYGATGEAEGRTRDKASVNAKMTAENKAGVGPGENTGKIRIAQREKKTRQPGS